MALFCRPSRGKCIHLQTGGWGEGGGLHNSHKKPQMVKDNDQLFMCVVVHVYTGK
jgi:hypothetical protein